MTPRSEKLMMMIVMMMMMMKVMMVMMILMKLRSQQLPLAYLYLHPSH
jgi:hypothetical protein